MAILQFELKSRSTGVTEVQVDAALVRVGSAAHCELRLPPREAAPELLRIEQRAEGLVASVCVEEPTVMLRGERFRSGPLASGATLSWASVELRVHAASAVRGREREAGLRQRQAPALYLALLLLPLALIVLLGLRRTAASREDMGNLPPLFRSEVATVCPQKQAAAALRLAEHELAAAQAAEARAPFAVRDGLLAVELFRRVQACLGVAGDTGRAAQAGSSAEGLSRRLSASYRAHQLALERALALRRNDEARTQIRSLLAYDDRQDDRFNEKLRALERQIALSTVKQERKR